MRAPDDSVDLIKVLSGHFDPELAAQRITEMQKVLGAGKLIDNEERKRLGWDEAYDLRPWDEFPDTEHASALTVILQNVTGGWLGNGGGPTTKSLNLGKRYREMMEDYVKCS